MVTQQNLNHLSFVFAFFSLLFASLFFSIVTLGSGSYVLRETLSLSLSAFLTVLTLKTRVVSPLFLLFVVCDYYRHRGHSGGGGQTRKHAGLNPRRSV